MRLLKPIWILLGTLSLAIGVTGIFVSGLPTTPFLLLTAGLYLRSSEKLYNMIISNRFIGPYILEFQKNRGMTMKAKIYAISVMWMMISFSGFFFIESMTLKLILLTVGIFGTIVMGLIIKTVK